jgi:hypothetical protein
MEFDFLPEKPKQEKPNTESGTGSKFSVGKNVFYDNYLNHLDAHKLFSIPPKKEEFVLSENFDLASLYYSEKEVKSMLQDNFYGKNTVYEKLIDGYTEFQNIDLLNEVVGQVDVEIPADLFSGIEKPKMRINDRFGMFSYDLASMQMTYVYEYFDVMRNKVDSNLVYKKDQSFYFENKLVTQEIKRRENGTPVVISSVRNSLIDFEKKEKQQRAVEIFVINSVSAGETASSFIYNSMAAISVAKNLILKGFQVKLTALLTTSADDYFYYHFVPVKRFNQPLDINAAAYVCGDPRFYRYQGFKMYISGFDKNKKRSPRGLGTIFYDKIMISKTIENEYVKNSELKQADTRLYFGNSRDLDAVKKEVKEALEILNQKYGNEDKK